MDRERERENRVNAKENMFCSMTKRNRHLNTSFSEFYACSNEIYRCFIITLRHYIYVFISLRSFFSVLSKRDGIDQCMYISINHFESLFGNAQQNGSNCQNKNDTIKIKSNKFNQKILR